MRKTFFCTKLVALAPVLLFASAAAANPGPYGAIAVSSATGAAGEAENFDTQADAEADAAWQCAQGGATDCTVVIDLDNNCGAVAVGDSDGSGYPWGAAAQDTQNDAEGEAISACQTDGGSNCQILWSGCSSE